MNEYFEHMPTIKVEGRREIRDLAVRAFKALAEADLVEEMDALNARVFGRSADAICQSAPLDRERWQWSFAPFVELVLLEVEDVARQPGLTDERRRDRITWALDAAGF